MANYTKLAATAKRLIDKNGRTVTLIQQGQDVTDSDKPWRPDPTYARAKVTGKAVFTELEMANPEGIKRKVEGLLFAAADDGGHKLEDFDTVQDGAEVWRLLNGTVIAPGDIRVVYMFEVAR